MPRSRLSRRSPVPNSSPDVTQPDEPQPGMLITFRPGALDPGLAQLRTMAGVSQIASSADFSDGVVDWAQTYGSDMLVFNTLGVAVVDMAPEQMSAMAALASDDAHILSVEPEPIFFASGEGVSPEMRHYLRGYRDAVDHLYQQLTGETAGTGEMRAAADGFQDTAAATWGLQATQALTSRWSGRSVRVAVLDTGMDLDHPDFQGRAVTSRSFIAGQEVQDANGHGTHCIGTACGPRQLPHSRGYGVAYEAEIFVGKVLSNQGSSLGRSTLAGIEWAVMNGCQIISMSLGSPVRPGERFLNAFETLAREALRRNTLIIAAAGNESRRREGHIAPVGSPANCPSIMAVAAVDRFMDAGIFSNGSINPDGRVDIAGPGVNIYSSAPDPAAPRQPPFFRQWSARHDMISSTSMATPHVSGIAALLRQANPQTTAAELWRQLIVTARVLPLPVGAVGAGLVQAP